MLKTLIFAASLAVLAPVVAHADPWWQDQDRDHRRYDEDRRYAPRYQEPRWYGDGYGYEAVPYVRSHPAYDQYGPDPNGARAPDGHRIKCKLVDQWDGYAGQYVRRRDCW